MAERIVIDPITRIEGHLKIEVEVENGVVKDAWSAGTMARGWEILLKDRDPRDAPVRALDLSGYRRLDLEVTPRCRVGP